MSLWTQTATNSSQGEGGDYKACPAGNYPSVLEALIDLGTHTQEYEAKKTDRRRIYMVWEVQGDDNEVYYLGKDFNLLTGETSALRKFAEDWRGKKFADGEPIPLDKMLGRACMLNVVTGKTARGKEFAKIQGVAPLPKRVPVDVPKVEPWAWQMGDGEYPSPAWVPYLFGQPIANVIKDSHEYKAAASKPTSTNGNGNGQAPPPDSEDDEQIPF